MRFFILYLSLPLYFSQAGWLLWQPVALARFHTALMQEVITPDFQLTCRLDLARLTTEATVSQVTGGLTPKRQLTASDSLHLCRWIAGSDERRVGKERGITCRSGSSRLSHKKKNNKK